MGTNDGKNGDGENKSKSYDEISELLKKYYKPDKEVSSQEFLDAFSKKIEALFHKELMTDALGSDEQRYWQGLEKYIKNEVSSLKHKSITDHLLSCKECRKNYNDLLDKKKPITTLSLDINKSLDVSFV